MTTYNPDTDGMPLNTLKVKAGSDTGRAAWDEYLEALADLVSGGALAIADAAVLAKLTTMDVDTGAMAVLLGTIDGDTDAIKTVLEDAHNSPDSSLDATIVNPIAGVNSCETAIDGTLDDSPTSITSTPIFVGDCAKVGFMFRADITSVGLDVAISCTVQGGPENDDLVDLDIIIDKNGEDAPQSSISIGSLGIGTPGIVTAFAYLPVGFNVQWITIKMDGGATVDADDTAAVDAFVFKKKG